MADPCFCPCCKAGIPAPHEFHLERREFPGELAGTCGCDATCQDKHNCRYRIPSGVPGTSEIGKRSTSAATASGHELPNDTAVAAPAAAGASLSVANGGDARVASAGRPLGVSGTQDQTFPHHTPMEKGSTK